MDRNMDRQEDKQALYIWKISRQMCREMDGQIGRTIVKEIIDKFQLGRQIELQKKKQKIE